MPSELAPQAAEKHAALMVRTMDVIGERWMIAILLQIACGENRFRQIQRNLDISATVLARKLKMLVVYGLLQQRQISYRSHYSEYALTESGQALRPHLVGLVRWANHYLPAGSSDTNSIADTS